MQADLQTISFRLANICGPRLAIGPIPTFYKRLKAGQNCFCSETVRDFLDMSDFVNLMDLAIQEKAPSGVFNVSTGVGNTIHDVFSVVSSYLNIEVPEVPIVPVGDDDVAEVVLDPVQTEKAFNWKANVNFEETINNQLRWYDKYGINDIFSHLADPTVSSQ
jgi:nucleoside-diphosphate-sugar epimerase